MQKKMASSIAKIAYVQNNFSVSKEPNMIISNTEGEQRIHCHILLSPCS